MQFYTDRVKARTLFFARLVFFPLEPVLSPED